MPVVLQDGWGGHRERSRRRGGSQSAAHSGVAAGVSGLRAVVEVTDSSAVAGVPWKANSRRWMVVGRRGMRRIDGMVSHTRRRVAGMRVFTQSGGEEVGAEDRKSGPRCQRRPRPTDQGIDSQADQRSVPRVGSLAP